MTDNPGRVALDTTDEELNDRYPPAGDLVDGRSVREHVPNMASIAASLPNHELLEGVRHIPMAYFSAEPSVTDRTRKLAQQIDASKEINPLIVAVDHHGPYILEGGHRYDALRMLGAGGFPARVALDLDDLPDTLQSPPPAQSTTPNIGGPGQRGARSTSGRAREMIHAKPKAT